MSLSFHKSLNTMKNSHARSFSPLFPAHSCSSSSLKQNSSSMKSKPLLSLLLAFTVSSALQAISDTFGVPCGRATKNLWTVTLFTRQERMWHMPVIQKLKKKEKNFYLKKCFALQQCYGLSSYKTHIYPVTHSWLMFTKHGHWKPLNTLTILPPPLQWQ